jgi:hypothetical protein
MPSSWSAKRERQYEHIKQSAAKKGRSAARAKEIAAATVNKQRRKAGETTKKSSDKNREAVGKNKRRQTLRSTNRKSRHSPQPRSAARSRGRASTRRRKAARR